MKEKYGEKMNKVIKQLGVFNEHIPFVKENRSYWLFRTNGGEYYDTFKEYGVIGLNYGRIPYFAISKIIVGVTNEKDRKTMLSKLVSTYYPDYKRPGYISSQILKFINELKTGDVILIPSFESAMVTVGIVKENIVFEAKEVAPSLLNEKISFLKKVEWKTMFYPSKADPELYKMFFSHHPISNANEYSHYINRILNPLYQLEGVYYLSIHGGSETDMNGRELFSTWEEIFDILDGFFDEESIDAKSNEINIKLRLQSAGVVEFITNNPYLI